MLTVALVWVLGELVVLVLAFFLVRSLVRGARRQVKAPDEIRWILDCPCGRRDSPRREPKKGLACACGRAAPPDLPRGRVSR